MPETTRPTKVYLLCNSVGYSFIQKEIYYLSKNFKNVYIVRINNSESDTINFSDNVHFIHINDNQYSRNKLSNITKIELFFVCLQDIFSKYSSITYWLKTKSIYSLLLRAKYISSELKKHINTEENSLFLSYWFDDTTTILSLLKKTKIINRFFTRAHGRDLFEEREPHTRKLPLRSFQMKYVDKVFPISKKGSEYLKARYKKYQDKIIHSYLGTEDMGVSPFEKRVFTVVSCAHIRNIKRIHLIPEILKHINIELHWVHFGNLESKKDPTVKLFIENTEQLKEKPNITFEWYQNVSHNDIYSFYKSNPIHLFLNVSEYEGIPVSIMEAISMGIPVIATNVGGCDEIVTDETGILINKDFNPVDIAKEIYNFMHSEMNTIEFRKRVRDFWQSQFCAKKNYNNYIKQLINP